MSEDNSDNDEVELSEQPYGDLMNLARSAREQFDSVEIDTDAPKKDELVDALSEFDPEGSRADGWTIEVDGSRQEVDLLQVQTPDEQSGGSSGPSDETILYGLTRSGTTQERVDAIREALESQTDFTLERAGSEDDPKYAVVLPVENQDIPEDDEESDEGDSSESGSEDADEDSDSDEGEESEEAEESESDESDGSDSESESEDDSDSEDSDEDADEDEDESEDDSEDEEGEVPFEVVVDRLEDNNTKDELYEKAVEADIDGRTDLNKSELAEALVEHRRENGEDIAAPADD